MIRVGLLNLFTPTFAVVTGALIIGRVSIATWWKFVLPLVAMLAVLIMVVLSIGVIIKSSREACPPSQIQ